MTVKKRKGAALMAIHEIRTVVDDCRSLVCGGLATGLELWELGVLPQLLFNAECWFEMTNDTLKELENTQLRFYRSLLAVGSGCPTPLLYWETGGLLMKYRILKKKLLFIHHVATLPTDALAREVYDTQRKLNLPGIYKDCEAFLIKAGVTALEAFSSPQWKKFVKKTIAKMNRDELVKQMRSYKKINQADFTERQQQVQLYMKNLKVSEARLRFKIESGMTPTVRMNFMNDEGYRSQQWVCPGCNEQLDTESHNGLLSIFASTQ